MSDDASDKRFAIIGYTVFGSCIGGGIAYLSDNPVPLVMGTGLGFSTGLISQYRITSSTQHVRENKDASKTIINQGEYTKTPMWRSFLGGVIWGKGTIPLLVVGACVIAGFSKK